MLKAILPSREEFCCSKAFQSAIILPRTYMHLAHATGPKTLTRTARLLKRIARTGQTKFNCLQCLRLSQPSRLAKQLCTAATFREHSKHTCARHDAQSALHSSVAAGRNADLTALVVAGHPKPAGSRQTAAVSRLRAQTNALMQPAGPGC